MEYFLFCVALLFFIFIFIFSFRFRSVLSGVWLQVGCDTAVFVSRLGPRRICILGCASMVQNYMEPMIFIFFSFFVLSYLQCLFLFFFFMFG